MTRLSMLLTGAALCGAAHVPALGAQQNGSAAGSTTGPAADDVYHRRARAIPSGSAWMSP